MRLPQRIDGFAPIADYGVIGNERTAALVGLDGSIDFLCLPRFDSEGVFAALLDPRRGGSFQLAPAVPFEARHRYLDDTNVLETTFATADGEVRVLDALTIPLTGPPKWEELVRRVEPISGEVPMRWRVDPRFGWGERTAEIERRGDAVAFRDGDLALVVRDWDAGEAIPTGTGAVTGEFTAAPGSIPLLSLSAHQDQPWLLSDRRDIESRIEETCEYWRRWLGGGNYEGPWRDAVQRSALALAMLVHAPSGAMMAAATTSLPEAIGGSRNFDYRYCWLRDTAFSLQAIQEFGRIDQVHATLTWLLRAIDSTAPNLQPFYSIDGSPRSGQRELPLSGYRGSAPTVAGNDAGDQLQLGNFGDLVQSAERFVQGGHSLGRDAPVRLGTAIDFLTVVWDKPDSSIWELPDRRDYTQGKLAAWMAFDRALILAEEGELTPDARQLREWRTAKDQLADYIDRRCWSDSRNSYCRFAGSDELDAGTLLLARSDFLHGREDRLRTTIRAIEDELGAGDALLYRYSGMQDQEGAFVACSFWMIEALAAVGEIDRARERMESMVARTSDVGLLSEEIDPVSGEFLGNLPQALSHLALINAAFAIEEAERRTER